MISWLLFYEIVVIMFDMLDMLWMIFIGYIVSGGDMMLLCIGIDGISQVMLLDMFKMFLCVGYFVE